MYLSACGVQTCVPPFSAYACVHVVHVSIAPLFCEIPMFCAHLEVRALSIIFAHKGIHIPGVHHCAGASLGNDFVFAGRYARLDAVTQ